MTLDLWNFKSAKDLEKSVSDLPDTILKEQISLLGEKTNYVLYGKPMFLKTNFKQIEYKVATIFNIIVPALDDYKKILLIMYSNPEDEYPIAITVGQELAEDNDLFYPDYTCSDKHEFIKAIKEILSSEKVMKIIQILYSKASMLGD